MQNHIFCLKSETCHENLWCKLARPKSGRPIIRQKYQSDQNSNPMGVNTPIFGQITNDPRAPH